MGKYTIDLCNRLMDEEEIVAENVSAQRSYFNQLCRENLNPLQKEVLTEGYRDRQKSIDAALKEIHRLTRMLK